MEPETEPVRAAQQRNQNPTRILGRCSSAQSKMFCFRKNVFLIMVKLEVCNQEGMEIKVETEDLEDSFHLQNGSNFSMDDSTGIKLNFL